MNKKIVITKIIFIAGWLFIGLLIYIFNPYINILFTNNHPQKVKFYSIVGLIMFFLSIYSWKKVNGTIITPFILWITSYYFFCFGQFFLYIFNIDFDFLIFHRYSYERIFDAQLFTLYTIVAFMIGALMSVNSIEKKSLKPRENTEFTQSARTIGWLLFSISIIPTVINYYEILTISFQYGYSGLFNVREVKTSFGNIGGFLALFTIPAMFLLLYSYRNHFNMYRIFFWLIVVYAIIGLISGDRDKPLPILVGVIILNLILKNQKIKIKKLIPYLIGSLIVLTMFPAFLIYRRGTENRGLSTFWNNYIDSFTDNNPLFFVFAEMGASVIPLIETMAVIPEFFPLHYGSTYLWGLTAIIPNLFWDVHPAAVHSNIAAWVKELMGISYGAGSSLPTEGYYNFGKFGFLCLIPIGYIVAKFSNFNNKDILMKNPYKLIFVCLFLIFSLTLARRGLYDMIRGVSYYTAIPLLLVYLLILVKRRYGKKWG
ncbi:O-antigen polysaccharide polymerase Wzy [Planococcus sp. NCCP-2050]|uniref:O-antigen polysaccharide polymerase Wzy n=1 Tax=Planococcus sp. NCCP-2050 TaxID=2944679 RepID=UPI00203B004F|nr:O-antigen polysaccharide polymerase Wzy [Planococcus sp. NCCP-2050]GKW45329.1 hypothetical protein NCCP2050_10210 [Planococcus sp. NCCP-2050]